jgi:type I restriction enzyme M protein
LISEIDSINTLKDKEQDLVGRVYEYFLKKFAIAEGKGKGEFYTPKTIVNLIAEMIEPYRGIIYDPCCGSGGMFVQSMKFIESHHGNNKEVSIYGQEYTKTTYKLAKMNLAIRGIDAKIELGDTLMNDKFPELKVDYVIANPPFNVSDYNINKAETHKWKYGIPPTRNANYAWLQHFVSKLAPYGTAGIVLANGSMSSEIATEGQIRKELIENDLVDCMVALPPQLFYNTQIPACLWFFRRNREGNSKFRNRSNEILFINASEMGKMVSRKQRELTQEDIDKIASTYHNWRNAQPQEEYQDEPGFCKSATIQEIRKNGHVLTPGRYIEFKKEEEDDVAFEDKMQKLISTLKEQMQKSAEQDEKIKQSLASIGYQI